ncbi:MAG: type II toxin-antitoxin system VapC family toxin [Bryobacteraceae bacterium]
MVVDTSALLAIIFQESHGEWAADQLQSNRAHLLMSSVNYAEVLILLQAKQPSHAALIRESIERTSIKVVASTPRHAEIVAAARLRYPFNLGDCFAYALAKEEACPLLTLDRDFRNTDISVVLPSRVS